MDFSAHADSITGDVVFSGLMSVTSASTSDARCSGACLSGSATSQGNANLETVFVLTAPHYFVVEATSTYDASNFGQFFLTRRATYETVFYTGWYGGGSGSIAGILEAGTYSFYADANSEAEAQAGLGSVLTMSGSAQTSYRLALNATSPPTVVPVPGALWLLGSALGAIGWLRRAPPACRA